MKQISDWQFVPARRADAGRWGTSEPAAVAERLAWLGLAEKDKEGRFRARPFDDEAARKFEPVWLPNDLVDGAAGELSPIELLRQSGNLAALRLLVDLYGAHHLATDGGVHWRTIRQSWNRTKVGEAGPRTVLGFAPGSLTTWTQAPIARPFLHGVPPGAVDDALRERFWPALRLLESFGLFEWVAHLVEADTDEAEVVLPLPVAGTGTRAERAVALAAHEAGLRLVTETQARAAFDQGVTQLVPVHHHLAGAAMVGLVRLRYRPRTAATASWRAREAEWLDAAEALKQIGEPADCKIKVVSR